MRMTVARRPLLIGLGAAALLSLAFGTQLMLLLRLMLGGAVVAYLLYPVSRWFSARCHVGRVWSILLSFLAVAAAIALVMLLLLPPLIGQMRELMSAMPDFVASLRRQARAVNQALAERGFGRLSLPEIPWERVFSSVSPILGGTASLAGSVVNRFTEWTLALMLGYYFLRDRERVLLHLELMVPSAFRRLALRMAASVHHEIGTFLRGQLLISAVIAALSALGLMLAGVRGFLPLGLLVGVFNMIPYFGPILGAIPAVLMALTQSVTTALFAVLALFAVQQLDGMVISPRIMGAMTGLHPCTVLLAITLGGSLSGVFGMLLAIPAALAVRAASRVWVTRREGN